jgi:hypothetical protein
MGKALLYYDSKGRSIIRSPRKTFVPPGNAWEVNKEWFTLANDRWKNDLTTEQRWAWEFYSLSHCDIGRDLFVGKQIQMWNMSPQNMVTWPEWGVQSDTTARVSNYKDTDFDVYHMSVFDIFPVTNKDNYFCIAWAIVLDDSRTPTAADIKKCNKGMTATLSLTDEATNYVWAGGYLPNGVIQWLNFNAIVE